MAYLIPAILTTAGVISPEWTSINSSGETILHSSKLYFVASRYLLPAALVLMTLSIDLKAVFGLGWKALAGISLMLSYLPFNFLIHLTKIGQLYGPLMVLKVISGIMNIFY